MQDIPERGRRRKFPATDMQSRLRMKPLALPRLQGVVFKPNSSKAAKSKA